MRFFVLFLACLATGWTQTKADWQQAYLFAYPLVLMDVTRQKSASEPNEFTHSRTFPTDKFRTVVRPNADTLYSSAWLDLSKEPILLRVPNTRGRYYLMQLLDAWTETVAVPGKRTTGTEESWFAIVGPGWKGKLPAVVKQRIDCPTAQAWLLGRTQTNGVADYRNVYWIQDGFRLMPLSQFPDGDIRQHDKRADLGFGRNPNTPPEIVAQMSDEHFFAQYASLVGANPPHAADAKIAAIAAKAADGAIRESEDFRNGVQSAKATLAIVEQLRTTMAGPSGWSTVSANVGRYGTNYMARAVVARVGLGANPPEDAVYLNCYKDPTGKPLQGAYTMHFDKDQLPPVEAFWSITVYDASGYFVANPIDRFAIGDRDALRFNPDGSLDLHLQAQAPADARLHANWLPVPESAAFNLSFRLYWPKAAILEGKWTPPPLLRSK
jgi:hypothetical protein